MFPTLYGKYVGSFLTSLANLYGEETRDGGLHSEKTRMSNHLSISKQWQQILPSYFMTLSNSPVWGLNLVAVILASSFFHLRRKLKMIKIKRYTTVPVSYLVRSEEHTSSHIPSCSICVPLHSPRQSHIGIYTCRRRTLA